MKRFLKKLFSRFSFVALTIILIFIVDVLLVAAIVLFLYGLCVHVFPVSEPYMVWGLRVLNWIIMFLAVLHCSNRDMLPETKIPWLLCILLLNSFGVAIYLTFCTNRPLKRQSAAFHRLRAAHEYLEPSAEEQKKLREELGDWADESEALYCENRNAALYTGTKTEYFDSGEAFAPRFIADLESAKEYIFLEYFIISKGKFWTAVLNVLRRKAEEGVEVRLMYDDVGSMSKVRASYHKIMRKQGIQCVKFNPFLPVVTNVHNTRDHRKIAVIDGRIGYTGGLNLADEYVNLESPYGHWKDSAVRLEGEGVKPLIVMFLTLYNMQRRSTEDFSAYIPERYERFEGEGYVQPYGDGPRPMYARQIGEDVYINLLNAAKGYVYIATPYLIIDYRMREALVMAAERGVDVRIITPHVPDKKIAFSLTRSNYMALIKGGVKIYEYTPGFIHSKIFLCDGEAGVVGTINLDYRSLMHHYENAVLMYKTKALEGVKADMDATFAKSKLQTEEDAKKNVVWRLLCEIAKVFAPLF